MFHFTVNLKFRSAEHPALVAVGHEVYAFGGFCNNTRCVARCDKLCVHIFNTVSLCWKRFPEDVRKLPDNISTFPSYRWGHTAVLIEGTAYLWGGKDRLGGEDGLPAPLVTQELYGFEVGAHKWIKPQVCGTVPAARHFHSACVLGKAMFVYGGWAKFFEEEANTDIHKLDTNTMAWSLIETRGTPPSPSASSHRSATIIGTKMFVFGGRGGDVAAFDTETDSWQKPPSARLPEGPRGHFVSNGELFIIAGKDCEGVRALWRFSPESFSWKKVKLEEKGPTGYVQCCKVGGRVLLYTPQALSILDSKDSSALNYI